MSPVLSATSNNSRSQSAKGLQSRGKIEPMHKNVQNSTVMLHIKEEYSPSLGEGLI